MRFDRHFTAGETIPFGNWTQGSNKEVMPLEWIVLSADRDGVWLVTKHIIECSRFDFHFSGGVFSSHISQNQDIRWESSEIRQWLNGSFLNEAFSPEEQELLAVQDLRCGQYGYRSTSYANNNTKDKVALLSCEDVEYTLARLRVKDCTPTPYAIRHGASEESRIWWLREQGAPEYRTAIVSNGILSSHGADSGREYGVRPAIKLRFRRQDEAEPLNAKD